MGNNLVNVDLFGGQNTEASNSLTRISDGSFLSVGRTASNGTVVILAHTFSGNAPMLTKLDSNMKHV